MAKDLNQDMGAKALKSMLLAPTDVSAIDFHTKLNAIFSRLHDAHTLRIPQVVRDDFAASPTVQPRCCGPPAPAALSILSPTWLSSHTAGVRLSLVLLLA